ASVVERPLVAGIAFLLFSLASYAVSRFELGVGSAEGSPALVADGLHARADAVATFLTGCSLIAYYFGTDVDRPVAGLLGLIILSFAAETLVNLLLGVARGESRYVLRIHTADVVGALADPRSLVRAYRRAYARLAQGGAFSQAAGRLLQAAPRLALVLFLLGYASTALYTVRPQEQAVVERFGRVPDGGGAVEPGLHLKLPWPVDRVHRVPSRRIRHLPVGNRTRDASVPMIWTRQHGTDDTFVSGDNNFIFPYLVIHWRVADVHAYRYGAAEPERLLENVAVTEITRRFAGTDFYRIALERRAELDQEMTRSIQASLDDLGVGIEVVDVVLKDIHPPRDVARSFEGVVAAMQDRETFVSMAEGYRNKTIPEARAEGVRQVAQAQAYVAENKTRSEGDAARFRAREEAYRSNRAVTRDRMYLDAMSRALTGRRKVLICPSCGQPDIWLDQTVSQPPKRKRGGR
ncbi:MAG: FtsH protease activity modulator HflK, partial [Myxococcota bacterium]|nr:FtsH protease activity modulator HflK [Myxococcota bacterium]